jgi:hypothetical protein
MMWGTPPTESPLVPIEDNVSASSRQRPKAAQVLGLVQGQELSVDDSFVEANAAKQSRIPREQLVEAANLFGSLSACDNSSRIACLLRTF